MIKMQAIGGIPQNAVLRELENGMRVITFTVAHNERWTDNKTGEKKEKTTWVNCNLWKTQEQSVKVLDYLIKGQNVYVEGQPSARPWTNKDGEASASLELRVSVVELIGKATSTAQQPAAATAAQTEAPVGADEDDLPF